MICANVKSYKRKYTTKGNVKAKYTVTKQINLSANCDLEGGEPVVILTKDEYNSLCSDNSPELEELQKLLNDKKATIKDLDQAVAKYKKKESVAIDTMKVNNDLVKQIQNLNSELKATNQELSDLKLAYGVLFNRGLLARIRNKPVNNIRLIETGKE